MTRRNLVVSKAMYAALFTPIVLAVAGLAAGLGMGTLCTNAPGNVGLDRAPCNRVGYGINANTVLQVCLVLVALAAATTASNRNREIGWGVVAASALGFVATLIYAGSY